MEISKKILSISIVTFITSLPFLCFQTQHIEEAISYKGWELLFVGAFAILGGGTYETFIWTANVFYFLSLFFYYKNIQQDKIFSFSLMSVIIAGSFYFCESVLGSESGRKDLIIGHYLGYYLWVISLLFAFIGIVISLIGKYNTTKL